MDICYLIFIGIKAAFYVAVIIYLARRWKN